MVVRAVLALGCSCAIGACVSKNPGESRELSGSSSQSSSQATGGGPASSSSSGGGGGEIGSGVGPGGSTMGLGGTAGEGTGASGGFGGFGGGDGGMGGAPDEGMVMPLEAWVLGGNGAAVTTAVAVDPSGNIVVTGNFTGSADFGSTMLTAVKEADVFVAKYTPSGGEIFAKRFGDEVADASAVFFQGANDLAVDSQGNIILCGVFYARLGFGGPVLNASGTQYSDGFLVKLDANGGHVWTKRYGDGPNDPDEATACTVMSNDDVVVAGRYATSIHPDNDGVTNQATMLTASGGGEFDLFVATYSSAGAFITAEGFTPEAARTPWSRGWPVATASRSPATATASSTSVAGHSFRAAFRASSPC